SSRAVVVDGTRDASRRDDGCRCDARVVGAAFVLSRREESRELPFVLGGPAAGASAPAGPSLVETNENGDAQVQVALPNVPGRWRVHARVVAREGGPPGEGHVALATRKQNERWLGCPGRPQWREDDEY